MENATDCEKSRGTEKEIIAAARELFREKGQENVTMQELMDKLKIAKGTIYHHFSSKQDLLEAIVEDLINEELKKKKQLLKSSRCRNLPALSKFKALVTEDSMAEDNEEILDSLHHHENAEMHARQLGRYLWNSRRYLPPSLPKDVKKVFLGRVPSGMR
ncbi:MAG: TetR/AcrR family transcriptional regulator [Desulfobacterales bacterium]